MVVEAQVFYTRDSFSAVLGEFTHLAILVEALSTVIRFNVADVTVFLEPSQPF